MRTDLYDFHSQQDDYFIFIKDYGDINIFVLFGACVCVCVCVCESFQTGLMLHKHLKGLLLIFIMFALLLFVCLSIWLSPFKYDICHNTNDY